MASNDATLKDEVRVMTDYSDNTLTPNDLDTVLQRAKKHIRTRRSFDSNYNFYQNDTREEALFWTACLFSKVAAGELDSQSVKVAAIDTETLYAKEDDQVTTWYRNSEKAINSLKADGEDFVGGGIGITSPIRDNRTYGSEEDDGDTFDLGGS